MSDFVPKFSSISRKAQAQAGVIYCAYGYKYLEEAVNSARGLKKHNDLPVALFTNLVQEANAFDCFDFITPFAPEQEFEDFFVKSKRLPSLKLFPLLASPFESTLHLDSDTLVLGPIQTAIKLLGHFDVLLTNEALIQIKNRGFEKPALHKGLLSLSAPFAVNAGVFGYSSSEAATNFLRLWISEYLLMCKGSPEGNWAGVNDQTALNGMFKKGMIRGLGAKINYLPNYVFNATGRMLPELRRLGLLSEVRIAHTHLATKYPSDLAGLIALTHDESLGKF